MPTKQSKKRVVTQKAWAVVSNRGPMQVCKLQSFEFEKEHGIKPQSVLVIGPRNSMRRWLSKWYSINPSSVVPVTITYSLPSKPSRKRKGV